MSTHSGRYPFIAVLILSVLVMGCGAGPSRALVKAAKQGNAEAQYNVGKIYADGVTADGARIEQDFEKALEWYSQAAEQGHALAQFFLGMMYERGDGVAQDVTEAKRLYRLAADQGMIAAQASIARLQDPLVYAGRRGRSYHTSECLQLRGGKLSGYLSEAKRNGLKACSVCKPPR